MDMKWIEDNDYSLPQDLLEFVLDSVSDHNFLKMWWDWGFEDLLSILDRQSRRPLFAATKFGQHYHEISPDLVMPGKKLFLLSKLDFLIHDGRFGGKLYDLLHEGWVSESSLGSRTYRHDLLIISELKLQLQSDDGPLPGNNGCSSGEMSAGNSEETKKNELKSPKILVQKPKEFCPESIRWENYNEKTFRFVKNEKIAKYWGARKSNINMNYKKFSRGMRYYYKKNILQPVPNFPLVYKFGPKASGLETDNSNFQFKHCTP